MTLTAFLRVLGIRPKSKTKPHLRLLFPEKPRYECKFCIEKKLAKDLLDCIFVPYECKAHLSSSNNKVCKACMAASMSAQLDSKQLLDIGCPDCGLPWEPNEVRHHMGKKDRGRFDRLDQMAQEQAFVPEELPDGLTMDDLLARGTRLCPHCKFPFVKLGGCDSMMCKST